MKEGFNQYIYIYAYCFITDGKYRFSIFNSMRNKMHFFDMCLFQIAKKEFRNKKVNQILEELNDNDRKVVEDFIEYLTQNELARFVDDINCFPLMQQEWDSPYHIKYSIIDVRNIWHNFDLIFLQLSELLCPEIEVRVYRRLSLSDISQLSETFKRYNFAAFYLLTPYIEEFFTQEGLSELSLIIKDNYRISLNIYGVPDEILGKLNSIKNKNTPLVNNMLLSNKQISGKEDCGTISINKLKSLSIEKVMENQQHNGCLNRMISIDEDGFIKNCPSMSKNWGNIENVSLINIYNLKEFRRYWHICNDMIESCSSCELRCVCLGCRAYIINPNDTYSKPLKCDYVP